MNRWPSLASVLVIATSIACSQESQTSRPASRPSEITTSEWQSWLDELQTKEDAAFSKDGASKRARFVADRLSECGVLPAFERKGAKATFLQSVVFVDAGFDPKQTYLETTATSSPVRIEYGAGLGVRGIESLDVSGPVVGYSGDATSEKVVLREKVDLDKMGPIGEIIKSAGGTLEKPLIFEVKVKDHIVFSLPTNNDKTPTAVPRYGRALRSNGAKAVVFVEDRGVAATSSPGGVFRADRFRRPAREDPPALFVTKDACKSLGEAKSVALKVRYAFREFDAPNVVGKIEGTEVGEAILVVAAADRSGQAPAVLLAMVRAPRTQAPLHRAVVVCVASRPDLEAGGEDWLLGHMPVGLKKIIAAVHIDASEAPAEPGSGGVRIMEAKRVCPDLHAACLAAFRARNVPSANAGECPSAQRAVDAIAARGIPVIGLLTAAGSMEDGVAAARVAADLVWALADRKEPLSFRRR